MNKTNKNDFDYDDEFRAEYDQGFIDGLKGNKNIFSRGDFDEYKITDEELLEHIEDMEKSYSRREFVNGNGRKKSYLRTRTYEGIEGKSNNFLGKEKLECEFDLKTYSKLSQRKIRNLPECSDAEFKKYCDSMLKGDHKGVPGLIKINGLKGKLQKKLHLDNTTCFIVHDRMFHISPMRKASYGQNLRSDEYELIPKYIRDADFVLYDVQNKSFLILAKDLQDNTKLNFVVFNKDKKGNYFATAGKRNKDTFNYSDYKIVGEGFEPSIPNLLKSQPNSMLSVSPTYNSIIPNSQNKSSKIKPDYDGHNVLHKSFDVEVKDITENNKNKKVEQVQKALNAMINNQPFIIKHIENDESKNYGDITLRIRNFDRESINKAVRKMSFSLDTPLQAAKGEAFIYKSQEELTNFFVKELTDKTKAVYQFVIDYFDLPEMRIVQKSALTHKGKILYNPETGKPIDKKEWKKFVQKLEEFLNRNYNGIGERIVLSSEALGRILDNLSKTNTLEAIQKMKLSDITYKHRTFDWISETAKNMKDVFGESLTRDRQARIQAAIDSAAQRVTNCTNKMRDDMQQIIIDGVRDRKSKSQISQALFDKCVGENRDFQRVADTEIQNNTTSAYIHEEVYHTEEGEKVYFKRFEKIDDNTCKKCAEIKGMIVVFSDYPMEDENIKDPHAKKAIWEGKTTGIPFSVMHPYCRGTWVRYYPK